MERRPDAVHHAGAGEQRQPARGGEEIERRAPDRGERVHPAGPAAIDPPHAAAETGENFVSDGARLGGEGIGVMHVVDQIDGAAGAQGSAGAIPVTSKVARSIDTRPTRGTGVPPMRPLPRSLRARGSPSA